MFSLFGITAFASIAAASCGAGLTAYNLATGPRSTASTIAAPAILSAGLSMMVIAITMMPNA